MQVLFSWTDRFVQLSLSPCESRFAAAPSASRALWLPPERLAGRSYRLLTPEYRRVRPLSPNQAPAGPARLVALGQCVTNARRSQEISSDQEQEGAPGSREACSGGIRESGGVPGGPGQSPFPTNWQPTQFSPIFPRQLGAFTPYDSLPDTFQLVPNEFLAC